MHCLIHHSWVENSICLLCCTSRTRRESSYSPDAAIKRQSWTTLFRNLCTSTVVALSTGLLGYEMCSASLAHLLISISAISPRLLSWYLSLHSTPRNIHPHLQQQLPNALHFASRYVFPLSLSLFKYTRSLPSCHLVTTTLCPTCTLSSITSSQPPKK